ncbi:ABC transporter ATP-binding protein [Cognaticolwellia beringensis]|uniref:ABC transporter ATP-binding protein n=1 Tax=Cognaticolwellia beringensis TaxID=1967665 RepID=A0A222G8U1_9GAMM|nr:ABC transporter ATP-binding protein [Cognaticolwellia beringensis]ASP48220.1 ABC transporter ATP-binding protein [Cognaticolwellia beringensis]
MLLDIQSLSHKYQSGKNTKFAIKSLSLQVEPGILGLLGPNGAGKSSMMRIIATITKPSQGNIFWQGQDIIKSPQILRKELGYLPQYFGVYDQLSGIEFLQYIASLKGLDKAKTNHTIEALLHKLNLTHASNMPLKGYSGGMKQRIGIAQALLNDPKLLIIDEPTVGLDPHERASFRQLLSELAGERCIIFSTHIVADVESIADRIAIMHSGQLIQSESPSTLLHKVANKCWQLTANLSELKHIQHEFIVSHSVRKESKVELNIVADFCPDARAISRAPSLEDAYLYFTSNRQAQTGYARAS